LTDYYTIKIGLSQQPLISSSRNHKINIHHVPKKEGTKVMVVTQSNVNQFSLVLTIKY